MVYFYLTGIQTNDLSDNRVTQQAAQRTRRESEARRRLNGSSDEEDHVAMDDAELGRGVNPIPPPLGAAPMNVTALHPPVFDDPIPEEP